MINKDEPQNPNLDERFYSLRSDLVEKITNEVKIAKDEINGAANRAQKEILNIRSTIWGSILAIGVIAGFFGFKTWPDFKAGINSQVDKFKGDINSQLKDVEQKMRAEIDERFRQPKIQKLIVDVATTYTKEHADAKIQSIVEDKINPVKKEYDTKLIETNQRIQILNKIQYQQFLENMALSGDKESAIKLISAQVFQRDIEIPPNEELSKYENTQPAFHITIKYLPVLQAVTSDTRNLQDSFVTSYAKNFMQLAADEQIDAINIPYDLSILYSMKCIAWQSNKGSSGKSVEIPPPVPPGGSDSLESAASGWGRRVGLDRKSRLGP